MGRRAQGPKLLWRGETKGYTVRFSHDGKRPELSTGVRDRKAEAEAYREAQRIWAEHITGKRRPEQRRAAPDSSLIVDRVSEWLEDEPLREVTLETYEGYSLRWARKYKTVDALFSKLEPYMNARLRECQRKAVANELSALRKFARWLMREGHAEALEVPTLPEGVGGTPYKHRRRSRAPELTPEETRKLIRALPEWSDAHAFPIRARFEVAYETSLRPATLDKLKAPDNYSKGAHSLVLTDADDKELYGRELPLSLRARRALDSVCPDEGVIFGEHDYWRYVRPAAAATLPAHKARIFTGQHLRSARITHWLEQTGDLPGVMYLAGQKHASTTNRYIRPTLRAARNVLKKAR